MDQKWLEIQSEELGEALAVQGYALPVPMVLNNDWQPPQVDNLTKFIDHTLLKPEAGAADIQRLCQEAAAHNFASVCVHPRFVRQANDLLAGSDVKVCTVVGFPLGANSSWVKIFETREAVADGADEIDMVIPIGCLKSGDYAVVYRDIAGVVEAAAGRVVKVILETALLSAEEIVKGCLLAKMAQASFVKTSTGFSTAGASVENVALMRRVVGRDLGVKASGGVRDRKTALAMIEAGATRIGTSSGVAIVSGDEGESGY